MFQEDILNYNNNQKELIEYIIKEFGIEVTLPYVEDIAENEKECCFSVVAAQTGTKKTKIDYYHRSAAPYQLLTLNEKNEPVLYRDNSQKVQHCNLIRPVIKINNYFDVFIDAFEPSEDKRCVTISEFPLNRADKSATNGLYGGPTDSTYTFYNEDGKLIRCHVYRWCYESYAGYSSLEYSGTCIIIPDEQKEVVANITPLYWNIDGARKEITSRYGLYSGKGFLLNENDGDFRKTKLYEFLNNTMLRELFQTIPSGMLADLEVNLRRKKQEEMKQKVLEEVKVDGMKLENAPAFCRYDNTVAEVACTQNPLAVQFTDYEFQTYYLEFVVDAINIDKEIYDKIDPEIRREIDEAMTALSENPSKAFEEMNFKLRRLKMIDLVAVTGDGLLLKELDSDLRDDFDIVFEAIKQNPLALEYASNRLKDNEFIVLTAISINPNAFKFASLRLRNDEDFVKKAHLIDPFSVIHATTSAKRTIYQDLSDNQIGIIDLLMKLYLITHEPIIPKGLRLDLFYKSINTTKEEIETLLKRERVLFDDKHLLESTEANTTGNVLVKD